FDFGSEVLAVLLEREQQTLDARRGHFQRVLSLDRIFDIQNTADLPTCFGAVFDVDAIWLVDVDTQQRVAALAEVFDAPQLQTQRAEHRLHHGLNLFHARAHACSTNKKWAPGPLQLLLVLVTELLR